MRAAVALLLVSFDAFGCGGTVSGSGSPDASNDGHATVDASQDRESGMEATGCESARCGIDAQLEGGICGASGAPCAGVCEGGVCIETLASGQNAAYAIALDHRNVYWTNRGSPGAANGSVVMVPILGGSTTTLATTQESPSGLAVSGNVIFWSNEQSNTGSIQHIGVSGGTMTTVAANQQRPSTIALSGGSIYWINATGGNLLRAPLAGGAKVTLANGLTGGGLTVDATHIYWSATGLIPGQGGILETALSGGAATTLAASQVDPRGVVEDGTSIYWVDGMGGSVMKCALAGCGGSGGPVTLASGQSYPENIAVDAAYVYWANTGSASVGKVATDGGLVTTVATGQVGIWAVAVDDTSIYWTKMNAVMKRTPK